MEKEIRLLYRNVYYDDKWLDVCEHVRIFAKETEKDDDSEYTDSLIIYCMVCKKEYKFTVLVN